MILSLTAIEAILRHEDIEGLLAAGAPGDEYYDEASNIQVALEKLDTHEATRDRIAALVMEAWERAFGPFSQEDHEKRRFVLNRVVHSILQEHSVSAGLIHSKASFIPGILPDRRSIH